MRHSVKPKQHELKYIRYRNYILHYIVLGVILLMTVVMSRVNVVFCNNYAQKLYPRLVQGQIFVFGGVSIPFINIFFLLAIGFMLFLIIRLVYLRLRYRLVLVRFYYAIKKTGLNLACLLLLSGIIFMFSQGILYNRIPFDIAHSLPSEKVYLSEMSEDVLKKEFLTQIDLANSLSASVRISEDGFFMLENPELLSLQVQDAMAQCDKQYPGISDHYPRAKKDWALGVTSFSGRPVFGNVITAEVLYNANACDLLLPYSLCRESARFSGFVNEEELTYIAIAACMASGNEDFQYSATVHAIANLRDELIRRGMSETASELLMLLQDQVVQDLRHIK